MPAEPRCPECGDECAERFNQLLALEFGDPAFFAVHHLTVPAYQLQHPSQLSERGWRAMRALLDAFLNSGLTPYEVRAQNREALDSGSRSWSMTRGPRLQLPEDFMWSRTIQSVSTATAAEYRASVEAWARQVLADTTAIELGEGPSS